MRGWHASVSFGMMDYAQMFSGPQNQHVNFWRSVTRNNEGGSSCQVLTEYVVDEDISGLMLLVDVSAS